MMRTIEVEIDEAGVIRTLDPTLKLPQGRAVLIWPDNGAFPLIPGQAFADWFTPEEDAAWAYMQSDNLDNKRQRRATSQPRAKP